MISRRKFIASVTASSAAAVSGLRSAGAEVTHQAEAASASPLAHGSNPPNILIFMPDQQSGFTVRPDSQVVKPNLDKFLAQSVSFISAHCPAPHCCPSRASFMTGLYPSEHGVYNNVTTETAIHPNPYPGTPFWGLWLKQAGYNMGYAGKIHVGRDVTPETCGFENWSELEQDHITDNRAKKQQQWRNAKKAWANPHPREAGEYIRPDWPPQHLYKTLPDDGGRGYEEHADTQIMRAGIAGMKRVASQGKPWCVMISNSGGHDPYDAPKRFVDLYKRESIKLPESFSDTLEDKPRIYQRQRMQTWSQLSDDETREALLHYYAKCSMQDALFGEMLAALEATGQAENTIVIYTSDHGDYMAAHGLWMKGVPAFREAYNIPAVVRWPKHLKNPGRQVDAFVDQVDWASTILDAAGIKAPRKLSGRSLVPWMRGETPADWRKVFCSQMNGVELYYTQRITMSKEWKYVYNGFDYDELYDLHNDPHEMRNLAFPKMSQELARLREGKGASGNGRPWPPLADEQEKARFELLSDMWTFAAEHNDILFNPYGTVALAPFGPGAVRDAVKPGANLPKE